MFNPNAISDSIGFCDLNKRPSMFSVVYQK